MTLAHEIIGALRFWTRRPLVALAAVVSLGVGLAVATSVFAVADAALWRPLPLPAPDRVVWVDTFDRDVAGGTSPGVFATWRERAHGLEAVGALRAAQAVFRDGEPSQRLAGAYMSAGVIGVLGLPPALGRAIGEADDRPGAPPVVMISDRFWRAQYGGAPAVLGRSITLNGMPRTIVGVMRPELDRLSFGFDWWAPLALTAAQASNVGPRYLSVIGRLAGDARGAAAELSTLSRDAGATGDTGAPLTVRVERLKDHFSAGARPILLPLLAAVLAVVVLASLNAASLLLAQGQARRPEIALRASLGASRARLARQLLFESCWLTFAAGVASLLVSLWLIDAIRAALPRDVVALEPVALDWRGVTFTFVLVAAVSALGGVVPALRNSSTDLRYSLSAGARSIAMVPDRLRRGLVMAQVALALTVGTAGALMGRTTQELSASPRGYGGDEVLTAAIQLPSADYPSVDALRAAAARIVGAAAAIPGVARAAMATRVPLSGGAPGSDLALTGTPFGGGTDRQVRVRFVTAGYFAAVGTPLVEGRDVAETDVASAPPVVLVNETLARRLGPTALVGRTVKFAVPDFDVRGDATPWSVIGIVADARDGGPRERVQPEVYVPIAQGPGEVFDWVGRQVLVVARRDDGRQVSAAELRGAIARVEPGLALYDVLTLSERLRRHLSTERIIAAVLVPLGAAGFALAAFGIFTLLMQLVAGRRRELAIRIALGASSAAVVRSLASEGFRLTAGGAIAGCIGAAFAARALESVIFGVSVAQPSLLLLLIALTIAMTLAAIWLPAKRAVAVDPAVVLRSE